MTTGLVWDERLMWHDTGTRFGPVGALDWMEPIEPPESAPGKRRIKNLLDASGLSRSLVMPWRRGRPAMPTCCASTPRRISTMLRR